MSAACPWASLGRRLAVKIAAMSKATVATIMAAMIPSCEVGGMIARLIEAAAPTQDVATTARWWRCLRSTQADRNGDRNAEHNIADARVHAHSTPPGRPHRPSTKAMRSKYATNSVIEIVENPLAAQSSNIHARTDERGILFNNELGCAVIGHQKTLCWLSLWMLRRIL